jgi:hypothetical protein
MLRATQASSLLQQHPAPLSEPAKVHSSAGTLNAMTASAHHYAQVTNTIGTAGGTSNSPYFCPTCQLNYQNSLETPEDSNDPSPSPAAVDVNFLCTIGGFIDGSASSGLQVEIAVTREFSTGVLSNCFWLNGPLSIEDCDIGSVPYCTAYTTPPDMHLTPTQWQVYPTSALMFWDTYAPCVRYGGGGPWSCLHGIALALGPDASLRDCSHHP